MKLSSLAIEKLTGAEAKALRTMVALALEVTERWILNAVEENKVNGSLTKMAAVLAIQKETGLSQAEILDGGVVHQARGASVAA